MSPSSLTPQTRRKWARGAAALSCLAALLVLLLAQSGAGQRLQFYWQDLLFKSRAAPSLDSKILLVTIDQQSLETFSEPFVFWGEHFNAAISHLFEAGAVAVGLDVQYEFHPQRLEGLGPTYDPLRAHLEKVERSLLQELGSQKLFIGAELTPEGKVHMPSPRLVAFAHDRTVLLNLGEAVDGTVRSMSTEIASNESWPTLSGALSQALGGAQPKGPFLINYRGPKGSFQRASLAQVAQGQVPEVAGKAILIGAYDRRFGDDHRTPYSKSGERDMPGVEVHANALSTLLGGDFIKEWTWPSRLLTLLCAGLAGWLAWSTTRRLLLAACLGPAGVALVSLLFWRWDILLDATMPSLAWFLSGALVYALKSQTLAKQQADLGRTFGHMVSPQVARTLLHDPSAILEPQEREITVLFVDINDFTTTSEKLPPREVIGLLEQYFKMMGEVIGRYDGTIKQYVGDEIMVIFGAPTPHDDHAERAVRTALAMVEGLRTLNDEGNKHAFSRVKIGVNSGVAVLGCVGTRSRFEYAAVGDMVNLGARIMGLSKSVGQTIVVSESTYQLCQAAEGIQWEDLGEHAQKGREQKVRVYGVSGE